MCIGTYESIAVYLKPKLTSALEKKYTLMELALETKRSQDVVVQKNFQKAFFLLIPTAVALPQTTKAHFS